jgi:hypothetical protein
VVLPPVLLSHTDEAESGESYMIDKESSIRQSIAAIDRVFVELLNMRVETTEATDFLRAIMDPKQLLIYDLALRRETEMLKCNGAEAYFAGCLMGAAMNEALLMLLCLFYNDEVKRTKQYEWSTRRDKRSAFRDVVGTWRLEQFIRVAEELAWIPNDVVAPEFVIPLSDAYRELAPISNPEMRHDDIEKAAAAFHAAPGPAMLRMIQDLRNSIHSGKWIRSGRVLRAPHFDGWCRIAIHISAEIRNCLIHLMAQKNVALVTAAKTKFDNEMGKLRAQMLAAGWDPADFDRVVRTIWAGVLENTRKQEGC